MGKAPALFGSVCEAQDARSSFHQSMACFRRDIINRSRLDHWLRLPSRPLAKGVAFSTACTRGLWVIHISPRGRRHGSACAQRPFQQVVLLGLRGIIVRPLPLQPVEPNVNRFWGLLKSANRSPKTPTAGFECSERSAQFEDVKFSGSQHQCPEKRARAPLLPAPKPPFLGSQHPKKNAPEAWRLTRPRIGLRPPGPAAWPARTLASLGEWLDTWGVALPPELLVPGLQDLSESAKRRLFAPPKMGGPRGFAVGRPFSQP